MNDGTKNDVFLPLEPDDPREVGGYRIAARLGAGGMGRVYLSHTPGGRAVALKVIRAEFGEDPDFRHRFQREVRAAERVQGLYTAPVLDSDTEGPRPWLATAYIPGPSLAEVVGRHGRLPVEAVFRLIAGIGEALQVIHAAGLVHRDLKPSNVLLATDGPRVIDFGIARAVEGTALTHSGVVVGTPSFMAPEQAAGGRVSPATDVFALGLLASFAGTGTPAFGEGTSHAVLYRIVHEHPDLSALPEPLRNLVAHCLAKDPSGRPSPTDLITAARSAAGPPPSAPGDWLPPEVAAELTSHATPLAAAVTPPPRRRRGALLLAAGATAAVLLAGGGIMAAVLAGGDEGAAEEAPPEEEDGPEERTETTPPPPADPEPAHYPGIELAAGDHLFLDQHPVVPRDSGSWNMAEIDFRYFTAGDPPRLRTALGNELVLLRPEERGSLATCRAETRSTEAIDMARVTEGSQVCVRTVAGHIALVDITALPAEGETHLTLDATVWRDAR
ncbi:serine/threonine-protein kinase [Streptomyces sp. SBT349]|uniref:serine/threonine-protein kinase n=1 Tax=Streptomyces sp. SBT349 TaxID=1580539 RepID=UPI00066A4FC4|nr:serine/threonine-protein kinase [Streptomyces sp. SBT349]